MSPVPCSIETSRRPVVKRGAPVGAGYSGLGGQRPAFAREPDGEARGPGEAGRDGDGVAVRGRAAQAVVLRAAQHLLDGVGAAVVAEPDVHRTVDAHVLGVADRDVARRGPRPNAACAGLEFRAPTTGTARGTVVAGPLRAALPRAVFSRSRRLPGRAATRRGRTR
ncbi:hypothetical protein ACFXPA_38135 [Amycolatopsis sp. NPDC059090]|uniref:hypothetical protein n=1 Tax=Amycolatopsis sp. NPDC059090 TaxID=3346723 RepID=UPI00366F1723